MKIIQGFSAELPTELLKKIGCYRRQIFIDRLSWPLTCHGEIEVDQFDHENNYYIIVLGVSGEIHGLGRLLPTTKPYVSEVLLRNSSMNHILPHNDRIWEMTRFGSANYQGVNIDSLKIVKFTSLSSLLLFYCLANLHKNGVDRIIATVSPSIKRLLLRSGFSFTQLHPTFTYNGSQTITGYICHNTISLIHNNESIETKLKLAIENLHPTLWRK